MMSKKIDKKVLFSIVIGIVLATLTNVIADTLVKSEDVYFDKTSSGLAVNNVQAAIDGTCTKFSNELTNFLNKIYPVGSIYISTASTNPSSFLGGTWEAYGKGQTLVGIDSNQTEFNTVGKTGGSKTVTLKEVNLPSHSHSIPQLSGSTSAAGAHTPSGTINRKELIGAFWDIVYQNTIVPGTSSGIVTRISTGGNFFAGQGLEAFPNEQGFQIDASHDHIFTGTAVANHTHTVTTNTNTTGSTGSGSSFSVQNPYITVYIWHRTK